MTRNFLKKVAGLLAIGALAVAMAGCGGGKNDSAGGSAAKDSAVVAISNEPDSFSPFIAQGNDAFNLIYNIYDGLMSFNPDGTLKPGLAEKYTVSPDGLTYTFDLKKDIKFHDGSDFDADDVVYTYEVYTGKKGNTKLSIFNSIESIEKKSATQVVFHMKNVDVGFLYKCIRPIVPNDDKINHEQHPIGTGAYKFVKYVPGQSVELERYDGYKTTDKKPALKTIMVKVMSDSSSKLMALQSGELDFAEVEAKDMKTLEGTNTVIKAISNKPQILAINSQKEPFKDVKVRRAIASAINKKQIVDTVMYGAGNELYGYLTPKSAYYDKELKGYQFDLEKAKQLMKEAGKENGFDMVIKVPSAYPRHGNTAQVIKEQLAKININVKIEEMEWGSFLAEITSPNYTSWIVGMTGQLDPVMSLSTFHTGEKANWVNYSNPEFDKIYEALSKEMDENKRKELIKKGNEMVAEELPCIPIEDCNYTFATNKNLKGFEPYPIQYTDFKSFYFGK